MKRVMLCQAIQSTK